MAGLSGFSRYVSVTGAPTSKRQKTTAHGHTRKLDPGRERETRKLLLGAWKRRTDGHTKNLVSRGDKDPDAQRRPRFS